MADRFTFGNFLKDFGMRIGAAVVVIGVFFGLGYVKRLTDLGNRNVVDSQFSFFAAAFLLIGLIAAVWILFQRPRV